MATNGVVKCALADDILVIFFPTPPMEERLSQIRARFPGLQIRWVVRDLYTQNMPTAEDLTGATILCTSLPPPDDLVKTVRFVQLTSAGADRWVERETYKNQNVVFCTASGTHPPQIAEWVIGSYLMMQHHFLAYAEFIKDGYWGKNAELNKKYLVDDSPGKRMGILGYGAIGRQCARVASALGMEVYAYTRTERSAPELRKDDSYCVPGTGDPDGVIPAKWFHGPSRDSVNHFLAQDLDILVIGLPLTESTRYIIDSEQFGILAKKRTFISNIARGKLVNTDALVEALEQGKIRGAALDVTDPEPLPRNHPLWKAPNLFISPHVSWSTPRYGDRVLDILEINLTKLNAGEPLINVMNREFHY